MVIAVNTRFLIKNELEGCGYFIQETFRLLTAFYPEHQFYFLFDRPYSQQFIFSDNVHPLVVPPPARVPVLWKIWYDVRIPSVLKQIKADVFVSPDGFCSLTTKVPQCMVVHDLAFLHHPSSYKPLHVLYLRHFMPRFLKKASSIVTVSEFSKQDIQSKYSVDPSRITVVYNGTREIFNKQINNRELVKIKYAQGSEYFLYAGAIQPRKNLINLLKAFSIFKKRQQSNMKLVLAGRLAWKNDEFLRLLKTYKYRHDVVLTGYLPDPELSDIMHSAYALVYPSVFEGFGVPVLEAMKSEVPVLTSSGTSMNETAGAAGLYFDPHNYNDIADKMMMIYKDEDLRLEMIKKGTIRADDFSWKNTAGMLWKAIMKASSDNDRK